jgi:thiol-disulfide isomerase/thioredoxin
MLLMSMMTSAVLLAVAPRPVDGAILKALDAMDRAKTIAYSAEAMRDETDVPTGHTQHSSVRGQVWLERLAPGAGLRWKIAMSTMLDASATEFEGAVAYWAYDGESLRMLHPEQRRADVREPTPANLSIITGFARSKVIAPGIVNGAEMRSGLAAAQRTEQLEAHDVVGVSCRGVRLHFADNAELSMSNNWTEWWIGPDDLPRCVISNFVLAGKQVRESLTLSEMRSNTPIAPFVFTPEVPSTFKATAPAPESPAPAADLPKPVPFKVGDVAPPIVLKDGAGKERDLAARKGAVTVLDFWGTWCGPCCVALPHLDAMGQKYAAKGVEIWAISCREVEGADPVAYAVARGFKLTVLPNGDDIATRHAVGTYPTTLVIGRDGRIAFLATGYSKDAIARLEQAVEAALAK